MFWKQYRHPERINSKIENTDGGKLTFADAMKISKRGELSCRQEKTKYGARYVSNCLSEPIFDKRVRANRWISSGDLVMGVTVDDFTLVDDIAFYQWVYDRSETKSLWDCDVLDKKARLEFLGRLMQREKSIPEKECVVPDKVWDKLIQNINDDDCLKPYIGLYSVDTEDIACAQLVNLLVTNYELFQYYWKRHLMSYLTNR